MSRTNLKVDGRTIAISHADRALFPDGLTKRDLAEYYRRIAPFALAHYRDRPLSMERYPDGIEAGGFFQKDVPEFFPDWIDRIELKKEGGTITYAIANNAATLVYLANLACITPHLALARADQPNRPDRLVIDLDPSDNDFSKVQRAAAHVREVLEERSLKSFVQTTGSRGLHIVVPLDRSLDFDAVRAWARKFGEAVVARDSGLMTVEHRKAKRGDRVFLDLLRNAYGQTSVAPYAVRARPGAPVATPIRWDEALSSAIQPRKYTVRNIFRRLAQIEDPWAKLFDSAQRLHD